MSPRTPDLEVLTPQHGNRHVKITLSRTKIPCKQFYEHRCYAGFSKIKKNILILRKFFADFLLRISKSAHILNI